MRKWVTQEDERVIDEPLSTVDFEENFINTPVFEDDLSLEHQKAVNELLQAGLAEKVTFENKPIGFLQRLFYNIKVKLGLQERVYRTIIMPVGLGNINCRCKVVNEVGER